MTLHVYFTYALAAPWIERIARVGSLEEAWAVVLADLRAAHEQCAWPRPDEYAAAPSPGRRPPGPEPAVYAAPRALPAGQATWVAAMGRGAYYVIAAEAPLAGLGGGDAAAGTRPCTPPRPRAVASAPAPPDSCSTAPSATARSCPAAESSTGPGPGAAETTERAQPCECAPSANAGFGAA